DGHYTLFLSFSGDSLSRQALTQFHFDCFHACFGAFETKRAAQLFGLATRKSGTVHRHPQELLLKQWHSERSFQYRFERFVSINYRFPALPALEIRMDHVPHDWPRPNDGHLDHDVVKARRPQSWQARHLRTAFDLKHADGVGLLQCFINSLVICWQMREIDFFTVGIANQLDRIFQDSHHAQPEQIHFDQSQIRAILFVPLDHHTAGHSGWLEWHD